MWALILNPSTVGQTLCRCPIFGMARGAKRKKFPKCGRIIGLLHGRRQCIEADMLFFMKFIFEIFYNGPLSAGYYNIFHLH
jgi:hypothetical protein